jgi:F0F1-type ATP synthase membrane subunit b/b'
MSQTQYEQEREELELQIASMRKALARKQSKELKATRAEQESEIEEIKTSGGKQDDEE